MMKNTIPLTLIHDGEVYHVQTQIGKYTTLRDLITDCLAIPGFGICKGLGVCGTCLVEIGEKYSSACQHTICCDIPVRHSLSNSIIIIK